MRVKETIGGRKREENERRVGGTRETSESKGETFSVVLVKFDVWTTRVGSRVRGVTENDKKPISRMGPRPISRMGSGPGERPVTDLRTSRETYILL